VNLPPGRTALGDAASSAVDLEFLDDPPCAVLRVDGPVRPDSGVRWFEAVRADARYRPDLALVFDVGEADFSGVSTRVMHGYLQHMKAHAQAHGGDDPAQCVAIVAPDDLAFGMGRMFAALARPEVDRPRGVFRTLDAALAWLREGGDA
jgi:hypothetical protein